MKTNKQYPAAMTFLSAVIFLVAVSGCSRNDNPAGATGDAVAGEELDLEQSFGGYTTTAESPGFGDDELLKSEDDGIDAEDALQEDPGILDLAARAETRVYSVRLAWGMLEGDSTVTAETDWSGSVSLTTDGAIVVERIIHFERGDYIVRPRTDRMTVGLVSNTGRQYDGLLLTLYDPEESDVVAAADVENVLEVKLGGFEMSWPLADLDSLDEIIDVDNLGNQFAIQAFQVTDFCPRGFLSGRWAPTRAGRGVFRGRWTSRYGLSHGWLKGHWGTNDAGDQVFFGKYIGQNGEFRGLLRGTWGRSPDRPGGWFQGRWHRGDRTVAGGLRGIWVAPPPRGGVTANSAEEFRRPTRAGFFEGKWRANCDGTIDDDPGVFDDGEEPVGDPAGDESA